MAPSSGSRSGDLARLLARRVAATDQALNAEVSVAELRRRLVPYEVARADLALATKAEYDLALLELLSSEEHLEAEDREVVRAAKEELDSPEPGLAFLQNYAASHLRLRLTDLAGDLDHLPGGPSGEEAADSGEPGRTDEPVRTGQAEGAGAEDECWSCGEQLPVAAAGPYCVWCGADLTVRRCGGCGTELELGWSYCPGCGREAEA